MAFGGPHRRADARWHGAHDIGADVGPLPSYTSPNYSTLDTPSAASAPTAITAQTVALGTPLLFVFIFNVRSVYEAQRTPEGRQFERAPQGISDGKLERG